MLKRASVTEFRYLRFKCHKCCFSNKFEQPAKHVSKYRSRFLTEWRKRVVWLARNSPCVSPNALYRFYLFNNVPGNNLNI